jgi:DNA end-binding protein Ku
MARSMWRGAIQWGLVTIPVKLYLATESRSISFNMLHEECLNRIQMRTWCPHEDVQISRGDTVRGYEYAKDRYVVITDEDLAAIPLPTVRSIEVERFVPATPEQDEPPRYVKQTYYVEPEPLGRRAYALFREVLAEKDLVAICKVVIKDREALSALGSRGPVLVLETLHWPDEIRSFAELDLPEEGTEVKPAERAMAAQLVEPMVGAFDPTDFRDEYRSAVEEMIASRVEGREVVAPEEPEVGGAQLADLMAMLEASVRAATAGEPAATAPATKSARAAGAAARPTAAKAAKAEPAAKAAKAAPAAKAEPAARAAKAPRAVPAAKAATGGRGPAAVPAKETAAKPAAAAHAARTRAAEDEAPKVLRRRSA